jgi:hypothetical protein
LVRESLEKKLNGYSLSDTCKTTVGTSQFAKTVITLVDRPHHSSSNRHQPPHPSHQHQVTTHLWRRTLMNLKMTSIFLAGLLSVASAATFAASGDGADATGTKSGATSGSTMPPDNTPGSPSSGNSTDSGGGSGTGTSGGASGSGSGSGAGGGTGAAGGGTGGAGGGTGS